MGAVINATAAINNQAVSIIQYKGVPVVTSEMLADFYGTDTDNIKQNSSRNADKFVDGKHFFKLEGLELRDFKDMVTNGHYVPKNTARLTLWTERGAMRHAKLLETDRAWEVFEQLEDSYFRSKQAAPAIPQTLHEALRLAADLAEHNQAMQHRLAVVAPKAEILDRIASGKNMLCLQDAAKHLHVSCKHLINTLANNKWIYRRATSNPNRQGSWTAYEQLTRKGCLYHDYAEANGEMRAQVLITEKGLIEAAKLLGVAV